MDISPGGGSFVRIDANRSGKGTFSQVVLLAGSVGHEPHSGIDFARALLPIPGGSLLDSLVGVFEDVSPPDRYSLCANRDGDVLRDLVVGSGVANARVSLLHDVVPQGTAGCLRACEVSVGDDPILISSGSVWMEDDPDWMLQQHRSQGNALTLFCTTDDELVGATNGTLMTPAGVYCCEPSVIELIRPTGFHDLKEQLVPAVKRAGMRAGAVPLRHGTREVIDWATYMTVVDRVLSAGRFDTRGYRHLAPGVWVAESAVISPSARIVGPALIGPSCRIGDDAVIIGPTMLGRDCVVGRHAWLVRTIASDSLAIPGHQQITDRLLQEATHHSVPRRHAPKGGHETAVVHVPHSSSGSNGTRKGTNNRRSRWTEAAVSGAVPSFGAAGAFWRDVTNFIWR